MYETLCSSDGCPRRVLVPIIFVLSGGAYSVNHSIIDVFDDGGAGLSLYIMIADFSMSPVVIGLS